jgi:deoxyribose-phosphate aldolase
VGDPAGLVILDVCAAVQGRCRGGAGRRRRCLNRSMRREDLARMIDHTLLAPEATVEQVAALCADANGLGVAAVCVSPSMLPLPPGLLLDDIASCTVVGFPSGAVDARVKAFEASLAFAGGAVEIDMVVNLGLVKLGDWAGVEHEIATVGAAVPHALVKVIVESGALTDAELVEVCRVAESAGADFVKTSTGFHPSGGATAHAVELMARAVDGRLGVKASGGIRDAAKALEMVNAGATRIGTSSTKAILEGLV